MTKEEKEMYNKKIKLYERLGAEKFQNLVFAVEKLKFKVIKKLFPNIEKWFDKKCDKQQKKLLARAKTEEEKKEIIRNTKLRKMALRKELKQERNVNYHMDPNRPTEIYKYLEFNKKIHINGLIKDAIVAVISTVAVACGLAWAIPILVASVLSAGINFECVNIENNIKRYGAAAAVIDKVVEDSDYIPSLSEIIAQAKTPEELRQLKELIIETLQANNQQEKKERQKIRGNK